MTWHTDKHAKLSTKWYAQSDEQAMITNQLSRSVHFDENYLFILSKWLITIQITIVNSEN